MRSFKLYSSGHGNGHHMLSGGRYPVLRTIAILYLILSAAVAIAGVCWAAYEMIWGVGNWSFRMTNVAYIIGGTFLSFIGLLAVAEFLKLAMDVARDLRILASGRATTTTAVVTPAASPALATTDVTAPSTVVASSSADGHTNRVTEYLDEETAEAALVRGH